MKRGPWLLALVSVGSVGWSVVNFAHGILLGLAVVLAYVSAFYGWAWIQETWEALSFRDPMVPLLWAASICGWLIFSIGGNVKVRGADEGATLPKRGWEER